MHNENDNYLRTSVAVLQFIYDFYVILFLFGMYITFHLNIEQCSDNHIKYKTEERV